MSTLREELYLISHILTDKDLQIVPSFKLEPKTDFADSLEILNYISKYVKTHAEYPSHKDVWAKFKDKISSEFDSRSEWSTELPTIESLAHTVLSAKATMRLKGVILEATTDFDSIIPQTKIGSMVEDLNKIKLDTDISYIKPYDIALDAKDRYLDALDRKKRADAGKGLMGLPTKIARLDDELGGIDDSDFLLITARTNHGKSVLATLISVNAWEHRLRDLNKPVLFFTTEMTAEQVAYRVDTILSHTSTKDLRRGTLVGYPKYGKYLADLAKEGKEGFKIFSSPTLSKKTNTVYTLRPSDVANAIRQFSPGLVVIDQLYDMRPDNYHSSMKVKECMDAVTMALYTMNQSLGIPFIVVAQTNREFVKSAKAYKPKTANQDGHDDVLMPGTADIQGSDYIGQKATVVLSMLKKANGVIALAVPKSRNESTIPVFYIQTDIDAGYYTEKSRSELQFGE